VLRCIRQDGSVTWQKQTRHAAHFALHDLTPYAIETTFGFQRGFFGLIAEGWDIEDTTGKGSRGRLPMEAVEVEQMAGVFDSERGGGVLWSVEEFNQFAPRPLTQAEIAKARSVRAALFERWFAVEPGGRLELQFE
jgi:hypothetical protein